MGAAGGGAEYMKYISSYFSPAVIKLEYGAAAGQDENNNVFSEDFFAV